MSLHIGNLSSRIDMEDLEHVFRRFGRCSIRVKDKYGFVVFDYPASAEKALKALRGTRICGEALTLSWSKHQPHAMPRFGAGGKPFKQPYRKFPLKENAGRRFDSKNQRDYDMDFGKADEGRTVGSSDMVDESNSYHPDDVEAYVRERDNSYLNNQHGFRDDRNHHLGDDRWEQIMNPSNESYLENDIEFDRYDPCHSGGVQELDEHQTTSPLSGSPSTRKSRERTRNMYHAKSHKNCYSCGEVGHKMRNCPLELKRQVPRSNGRMGLKGNTVPLRYQDVEPSTMQNRERVPSRGDSSQLQITPTDRKKEFRNKKRNRRDYESKDKIHLEKTGGPSSTSVQSGYTSSKAQSLSKPSNKNSMSSSFKSSPSPRSRSKTFKSRSTSPSMSSASLPKEFNGHLSPSSNKILIESKDSVVNSGGLSHGHLVEEGATMKNISEKDTTVHNNSVSKDSREMVESDVLQSDFDNQFGHNLLPHCASNRGDSENEKLVGDPANCNALNLEKISAEEICMVLKHYGLQCPKENEKGLDTENFFGSARLWPWEIIYYRRLKKGQISAENYSRRIAQNEKFGIVDKYVRCSSGWGQANGNNP